MAWQLETSIIIRNMIGDTDATPSYTDDRLNTLFLIAAQQLKRIVDFSVTYNVDIEGASISPDPTEGTRDEDFVALACLKACCVIAKAEAKRASGQNISIKDGSSSISLGGIFDGKKIMMQDYCKECDDAIWEYNVGNFGFATAIVSPFRYFYNQNPYGGHRDGNIVS